MKQVIQHYGTGVLEVAEVAAPVLRPGTILVSTAASVISAGTERHLVDMARKTLLQKAMTRPDLVRRVIDKARADGIAEAIRSVRHRLDVPVALGYSAAGTVVAVNPGDTTFAAGDRVACSGPNVAVHAETLCVPSGEAARIPAGLPFDAAAFGMVGAIALHAVHAAKVTPGDRVAVIGLGLLGLLAVQMLQALGCRVIGIDLARDRMRLAESLGADRVVDGGSVPDAAAAIDFATRGAGVAAALITAAAHGNEPIRLSAQIVRSRGRIVAVGLVGLDLPREAFFERELELVVPHGAGLSEAGDAGEASSQTRNVAEFLAMISAGKVSVERLITHRFAIGRAVDAYRALSDASAKALAIVLDYPDAAPRAPAAREVLAAPPVTSEPLGIGVVGAGLFARGTLLPELKRATDVRFRGVATQTGMTGAHVARRYGFAFATSAAADVINDPEARAVVIATRHDSHAALVAQALRAGKDVFVEKPLAMTADELRDVVEAWNKSRAVVTVGFNRRHSPHAIRAREFLEGAAGPSLLHIRVNAGDVPPGHWVNDPRSGGDRVRGEVCHFIDLVQFLAGADVVSVDAAGAPPRRDGDPVEDCALILRLDDGSIGNILYTARGTRRLGRERVEVFRGGRVAIIDDFHTTRLHGRTRRRVHRTWGVDRGHRGEIDAWLAAMRGRDESRVPFAAYVGATAATLAAADALQSERTCRVETDWGVRP